jgi:hypothetical protein
MICGFGVLPHDSTAEMLAMVAANVPSTALRSPAVTISIVLRDVLKVCQLGADPGQRGSRSR